MSEDANADVCEEQFYTRHALIEMIRPCSGGKNFSYWDFSAEAFRVLAELEGDDIIEKVPGGVATEHTYRLKKRLPEVRQGEVMTLTLEIAPDVERALEEKAQRAGMPLTAYAAGVLARDAKNGTATNGAATDGAATDGTASATAASDDLDEAMRAGAEIMAPLYAESLATGGELTAAINSQEDIYEYTADDLAAMEAGEFERPVHG